jgi:hypothetical protein
MDDPDSLAKSYLPSLHFRSLGAKKNTDGFQIFATCHSRSNGWSDFMISRIGVWSAVSSARPTPDSGFLYSIRSTMHYLSRSNGSDRVMILRFTNHHRSVL